MDQRTLTGKQAAALFAEMAELLEIRGGDPYRARSFAQAARILEKLEESLVDAMRFGALAARRGIGAGTLERLSEMLRTGTCKDLHALRGEMPTGVRALLGVDGIGPKTVRLLWTHLRIGSIEELERTARSGGLAALPRFGERAAERIIIAIEGHRKKTNRTPLPEALAIGDALVCTLAELPAVQRVELAGSARRRKDTVGDLDLLVASYDPLTVASHFLTLPTIDDVLSAGATKTSVRLHSGQQVDLRVLSPETFGAGLCYFTGSQQHNIMLRVRANKRHLKISEHGVFTRVGERRLGGALEEEVFAAVGMPWIPPELRENAGELEAAERGMLPKLVEAWQLKGDLHAHSNASEGHASVETMAKAAAGRGLEYLAITDHSRSMVAARGLDERALTQQKRELSTLEQRLGNIRLLAGVEVEILPDGQLDLDPSFLAQLDWVVGAVHVALDQDEKTMTQRLCRAMESGVVDAIAHPLNRDLRQRPEGVALDLEVLLYRAKEHQVALEVNGSPLRLDLPSDVCRRARKMGVMLSLASNAHDPHQLAQLDLALATARRGWVEARHVVNALSAAELADRRAGRSRRRVMVDVPEKVMDAGQATPRAEELVALQRELTSPPLSKALRARMDAWLRGEEDATLQTALEYLTVEGNP
ncbi:MAG: DNA polymerase/3'-5' exonuclease PolX, partial [Deltaproteobacteria bacterium]|nr:DNA polymerase/3'-5' exonuclease PolX [Deltaproteobacteria bacterium]